MKPSIEYLNSLNEYRKRARSTDDVGLPNATKAARIDLSVPPPAHPMSIPEETHMDVDALHVGEDPVVYGKPDLFHGLCSKVNRLFSKRRADAVLTSQRGADGTYDSRGVHGLLRGFPVSVMNFLLLLFVHSTYLR